jgi:hypothetical protein
MIVGDALKHKREKQLQQWVWDLLFLKIQERIKNDPHMQNLFNSALPMITNHEKSVLDIVDELFLNIVGKQDG